MLVELSHRISNGMTTYPGLPAPEITDHLTREETAVRMGNGVSFQIGRICMVSNTGTYVDVPFHYYEDGEDLAAYPLQRLAQLNAVTITANTRRSIGSEAFNGIDVQGRAVLVRTDWDRHFGTEKYGVEAPFLNENAVSFLIDQGAVLVGIDSVNIDDIGDLTRPAHVNLLRSGIAIVEHLRDMSALPPSGFRFTAAPPMVQGMGTFPVRAFAEI